MPLRVAAMRVSHLIVIYLAAAAPFGVAFYMSRARRSPLDARTLAGAALAALVWPSTLPRLLLSRLKRAGEENRYDDDTGLHGREVEEVQRGLINALLEIEDALEAFGQCPDARGRHTFQSARAAVELYAGLAQACAGADAGGEPSARELELCRVAGREGDDLLLAGRCVRRRNVARLFAHRGRARDELLRALVGVNELAASPISKQMHPAGLTARLRVALAECRHLAGRLFLLLEGEAAADAAERALGAALPRPRPQGAGATAPLAAQGDETCTIPAATTASVSRPSPTS